MDCRQITFVTLNRFCQLSNLPPPSPTLPVLNRQYQDEWNINQDQMKNMIPFYIVCQVLKVLLFKISHQILYFMLFYISFLSADIIFYKFLKIHSTLYEKKN